LKNWGVNFANVLGINASIYKKYAVSFSLYMWVRWTIPRFRYDQLMIWMESVIPLSIINIIITGIVILRAEIAIY
jgi:NADH-quinone oxidoreductase subunit H